MALTEFIYNNSVYSIMGVSPFFALYGYNPEINVDIKDNTIEGEAPLVKAYIEQL